MTPLQFIIIDNDPVNNLLCDLAIKDAVADAGIIDFTEPVKAFEYISKDTESNNNKKIVLLDINMPTWTGWDFVDHFEELDEKIKNRFKIYILSSSIDNNDKLRAVENKNVVGYIEKPLTEEKVVSLL
ncbi:response regulator [Ferruginibacter paludis]|uniref:response regulator n=1 Tax=Ferruginibacter paludis TaxID=1310417 RepID=UPI0025B5C823|nr:response regulator [Ferruginibacter paludis]MDN3656003.1 response regulator [Ferruginibacter paludis]